MNYIFVNGYGWTGSSAIVDYLKEFRNIVVPAAEKEFRLVKDPYGIIDLDRALNDSIDPLNEDIAIKKFIWMVQKYIERPGRFTDVRCGYLDDFGENIRIQTDKYINGLIDREYDSYWWFLDMEKSSIQMIVKRLLRKFKINIFEERLYIYNLSEEEFIKHTRDYLDAIFAPLLPKGENCFIALDNAMPATRPSFADRYFESYKMINVERDPRDVYVNLVRRKTLVGYYSSQKHDPTLFVEWYKKMRKNQEESTRVMTIWFEDFVIQYEKACAKIRSFLALSEEDNVNKFQYFDPKKSIKNVGIWKQFQYMKEIQYIEENLPKYLYDK